MRDIKSDFSRSPHGERGLKSLLMGADTVARRSLPTRGAWIEIQPMNGKSEKEIVAPHTGSVD